MKSMITRVFLFSIFLLVFMSACTTKKKCMRLYPPIESRDSIVIIKTNTITKDTTIFIYMPADTVYLSDTIYLDENGQMASDTMKSALKWSYAAAWVANNRLYLEHQTKDTIIEQLIENAIRESKTDTITRVDKKATTRVPFIPWWAKGLMWLSLPTILYILFRIFKLLV